ncbi:cellulose synthase [Paraburkholderia sediminicola]|uniref:cellulose synthase n=1 Tax=Paraburkholderia sediminicola TaxID=458836 RepID=UPI0038BBA8A2
MNTQKLTILEVAHRSGIAKKTGNPWSIHEAQCILEQEDSEGKKIVVGTINLPDVLKDSAPGDYLAQFSFFKSMEGKLEPRVVSLVPFGMSGPKAKAGAGVMA